MGGITMKSFLAVIFLLFFMGIAYAEPAPCLVVSHASTVGKRLTWFVITGLPIAPGANFDYVDSTMTGTKMKYSGKELQALQKTGVHVVVIEKTQQVTCSSIGSVPTTVSKTAAVPTHDNPSVLKGTEITFAAIDALPFPGEVEEAYTDGSIVVSREKKGYRVVATNRGKAELQHVQTSNDAFALVQKYRT